MIIPSKKRPNSKDFLYKYFSLEGDRLDRFTKILSKDKIYFSPPSKLNDPFECHVNFSWVAPSKKAAEYWKVYLDKEFPNLNRKQRKEKLSIFIKTQKSPNIQKLVADVTKREYNQLIKKVGVLCLTPHNDKVLMWSHYADSHKGVCLQFKRSHEFLQYAEDIEYEDGIPTVNLILESPIETVNKTIRTKGKDWEYEDEVRIFDRIKGFGEQKISADLLSGVIFGCEISQDAEDAIIKKNSLRINPLEIYKADMNSEKYELSFSKVNK